MSPIPASVPVFCSRDGIDPLRLSAPFALGFRAEAAAKTARLSGLLPAGILNPHSCLDPPHFVFSVFPRAPIALALIAAATGCTRSVPPEPPHVAKAPRIPIAAQFEYSTWSGLESHHTPSLVVYNDGLIVVRRNADPSRRLEIPEYWRSTLDETEIAEIKARQTAALRDPGYAPYYNLTFATDQPYTVLYFGAPDLGAATAAYGLWLDGAGRLDRDLDVEQLPQSLLTYYVALNQFARSSREWKRWRPDSMVALLRSTVADHFTPWPAAWPGWNAARLSRDQRTATIVVPVASNEQFWSALSPKEENLVALNGRTWWLDSLPYFPGSEAWRDAVDCDPDSWRGEWHDVDLTEAPTSICICGPLHFRSNPRVPPLSFPPPQPLTLPAPPLSRDAMLASLDPHRS